MYTNLKKIYQGREVDYATYVASFDAFHEIPRTGKDKKYKDYLNSLKEYLEDFFRRSQPLLSLSRIADNATTEFDSQW